MGSVPVGVLLIRPLSNYIQDELSKRYTLFKYWQAPPHLRHEFLAKHCDSIRAVVGNGVQGADGEIIDALPRLEIVASHSAGVDKTDLDKCRERGIRVTYTPDALTDEVADMALLLALATARRICAADRFVRKGEWRNAQYALTTKDDNSLSTPHHSPMMSKAIMNPKALLHNLLSSSYRPPPYSYTHIKTYVQVYMKRKKDPYFDSIDFIHKSLELKPIIAMKDFFVSSSNSPHENYCIPISDVSKKGSDFGLSIKVIRFLRSYPSFFEEFEGPLYNLPWFRLTPKAIELDKEERTISEEFRDDIIWRLKKLILMSGTRKMLPLKVIKGLQWSLGLPAGFWSDPIHYVGKYEFFRVVDIEDGLKGLAIFEEYDDGKDDKILSMMQINAMKRRLHSGDEAIAFPLFPSKGLRLKQKIKDWLVGFQRLPYVSPYDDFSCLNPDSDVSEKRVVGLLHELLCLFVEHAAERKSIFCLRKYLGLPQKVHKAFERHPHMFYLSLKNNTCTCILKEAYCDDGAIEPHPLANVRRKYIALMKESAVILRDRRVSNSRDNVQNNNMCSEDLGFVDDEISQIAEARL